MDNNNIFEVASRLKLRFLVTGRGNLAVEDLWDLSEKQLNSIYTELAAESRNSEVESLIEPSVEDKALSLRKDVVRHVFGVKKAERVELAAKAQKRERRARLLEIRARKQDAELEALDLEALDVEIAELED